MSNELIKALLDNGKENNESMRTIFLGWMATGNLSAGLPDSALAQVIEDRLKVTIEPQDVRKELDVALGTLAYLIPNEDLRSVDADTRFKLFCIQLKHKLAPPND